MKETGETLIVTNFGLCPECKVHGDDAYEVHYTCPCGRDDVFHFDSGLRYGVDYGCCGRTIEFYVLDDGVLKYRITEEE